MSRSITIALAAIALVASPVSAQYIGIFLDSEAVSCGAQVGSNPWIDLHVIAVLEGAVTEMTGAQFLITGVPDSWTERNVLWVPDTGLGISFGNPLFANPTFHSNPGVAMAFSTCQAANRVPLGRVVILGAPTTENVHLRVRAARLAPADPACPYVLACGDPNYPKVCVGGGEIVLNGPRPLACGPTAVEPATWSSVKSLFH